MHTHVSIHMCTQTCVWKCVHAYVGVYIDICIVRSVCQHVNMCIDMYLCSAATVIGLVGAIHDGLQFWPVYSYGMYIVIAYIDMA